MAVNIHITIIELNALHTKRQNLFQELDAVIHLLMEAKHWGLRKSRNATSLNSRFKSLDTLKVKIISVTFRRVIRTNHKKASKIWRHENIQLGVFPLSAADLPPSPTKSSNLSETAEVPACNVPSRSPLPALAIAPETKLGTASSGLGTLEP